MAGRKVVAVVVGGLLLAVFILSVGLAYERGHNRGYNEGWTDGRVDALDEGEERGWRGRVEENNLYKRYYYENS